MDCILFNPNLLQCADYTTDDYTPTCAIFVNENITQEQAANLMAIVWQASNDRDKQLWQTQVQNDLAQQALITLQQQATQQQQASAAKQDLEAAHREEVKKNKSKYTPIPDRPRPTGDIFITSKFTIQKLAKGLFLELWYYTNEGLDDAVHSQTSVDDEAMVMTHDPSGVTSWVPAASARNTSKVCDDKDMAMEDFCHAVPRMIVAMEDADWPPDHVAMLVTFWANLLSHPFRRSSRNSIYQRALLAYQAKERRLWHAAITAPPPGTYNLSVIDEGILQHLKNKIYWDDHTLKDNQRDYCTYIPITPPLILTDDLSSLALCSLHS